MRRTLFRKLTSTVVALTHLVFSVLIAAPGLAHAQTADTEPPVIELELVEEGVRGETQVFSATVTDDNAVSSMTLHYRFANDAAYIAVPMSLIQGTNIYTASIDTNDSSAAAIQYYMEAKDAGGNRTVQGFAFDPFDRVLVDGEIVAADASSVSGSVVPVVPPSRSTTRKIAYGLLGLLVIGGLVSASGGSSGGNNAGDGEVELTIVVDKFQ